MKHLYKATEWQSSLGWHSADTLDLAHDSAVWYIPARILNMDVIEFLIFIRDHFNATLGRHNNFVYYCWESQEDCHRWTLYINKAARKINAMICE